MKTGKILKPLFMIFLTFFMAAGIYAAVEKIKKSPVFTVAHVEVRGVMNADREKLAALGEKLIGLNIFDGKIKKMTETHDPWIRKLSAERALPNSVSLAVFEEKPLFSYKLAKGGCFVFTASGRNLPISCAGVNIEAERIMEGDRAFQFASILETEPRLLQWGAILKEYAFVASVKGEFLYCPYDKDLFSKNFNIYTDRVRARYKRVEYADLTSRGRIFVKGERNDSSEG